MKQAEVGRSTCRRAATGETTLVLEIAEKQTDKQKQLNYIASPRIPRRDRFVNRSTSSMSTAATCLFGQCDTIPMHVKLQLLEPYRPISRFRVPTHPILDPAGRG